MFFSICSQNADHFGHHNRSHFQRSQTRNSSHAVAIAAHHGTERALGLASWIASRIRLNVVTVRSGRCLCG
ncbi:hypothetical protein PC129_g24086 [Phytophthora cactorum]|uniref:Uncharacterized protein n=1 Tax=Phytophthora cactorum TaxID=29920 RepID=A0A8T1ECR9_9STRA|nr:hypothetical protein PC118_g25271 [Phytophthora cactorum]KAG3199503.1 hypothetical protein PC129_g24086 [Phytophthora cactorum]KAG4036017.1 hypothetical protein PC123_g28415 [Phytophthora cactorum]